MSRHCFDVLTLSWRKSLSHRNQIAEQINGLVSMIGTSVLKELQVIISFTYCSLWWIPVVSPWWNLLCQMYIQYLATFLDFIWNTKIIKSLLGKIVRLKGTLSSLRQVLATESPLKMMKNALYFTLTVLFVLKMFKFLSWIFHHVEKRLD